MVVVRTGKWHDGPPNHLESMGMRLCDDLHVGLDYPAHQFGVSGIRGWTVARQGSQIIHAFQHDEITNTTLRQNVSVDPRKRIGAEPVRKQRFPPMPSFNTDTSAPWLDFSNRLARSSVQRSLPLVVEA